MRVLLLSPYHGGSHQAWAEGYRRYSRHRFDLLTLPARYWKWRMHGGAVTLARRFQASGLEPDVILATDMLDLGTFLSLTRERTAQVPAVLYMHENQLTYPLPGDEGAGPMRRQGGERDLHYAFVNYSSMLCSSRVIFNSRFHFSSVFSALPGFLNHFPEFREEKTVERLRARSSVLPVGLDPDLLEGREQVPAQDPPLILWNQRWEYDKDPGAFLEALLAIAAEQIPFHLALCGQAFQKQIDAFGTELARLGDRIVHLGFAPPDLYRRLLGEATLTVSTALHEFFGISILEAVCSRTFPILPDRLSYPEVLPARYHGRCLYRGREELLERLRWALLQPREASRIAVELAVRLRSYSWERWAPRYDRLLEEAGTASRPESGG